MGTNNTNSTTPRTNVDPIKIVDLFAGPGGLGEGFSASGKFRITVSAEMETSAHATLRLRAFYRTLMRKGEAALNPYFELCNRKFLPPTTEAPLPHWDNDTQRAWEEACCEALQLTLGKPSDNEKLDEAIIRNGISANTSWVLIGGPPCQAYSLVGRARNKGKDDYRAEDDHRHFLYKEYLRIIARYKPSVFVMENVKGILSSRVGEQQIFHGILHDLADPDAAMDLPKQEVSGYRIHSLVTNTCFTRQDDPTQIDARDFIVRAEQYGVPQARHRVILLGIREDICLSHGEGWSPPRLSPSSEVTVKEAIGTLPRLRSKISRGQDSEEKWKNCVTRHVHDLAKEAVNNGLSDLAAELKNLEDTGNLPSETCIFDSYKKPATPSLALNDWYARGCTIKALETHLNHEARGHMDGDLRRYVFASAFAQAKGRSPKGYADFSLSGLAPAHENWKSGKFADRFRVQLADRPATTVTSHIAKDGHYFIHYDPSQCRSLSVREAARLQTFPDDYFFQGNRTQQYHQVGNAVPSYLAHQIARCVLSALDCVSLPEA